MSNQEEDNVMDSVFNAQLIKAVRGGGLEDEGQGWRNFLEKQRIIK